ncbi:MAG: MarR family winged helix-turn-helix transcriptional regulator [Gammaproteobacteria bacterium]
MTTDTQVETLITLENFVPYRLATLSHTVSSAIADAYAARFDLNIPQWRIFCILAQHPGLSAREVAEQTAMDKVAVSRAVNQLLERELITRSFDAGDRRRSILTLSNSGVEVYNQVAPYALEYERRLLSGMSEEDIASFYRIASALRKAAEKIEGEEAAERQA